MKKTNQVLAEKYSTKKITFEQGDALELEYENNSFDTLSMRFLSSDSWLYELTNDK